MSEQAVDGKHDDKTGAAHRKRSEGKRCNPRTAAYVPPHVYRRGDCPDGSGSGSGSGSRSRGQKREAPQEQIESVYGTGLCGRMQKDAGGGGGRGGGREEE